MSVLMPLTLFAVALLPLMCSAHWRLVKPVPRSGGVYENDPLPPDANMKEDWVCRNAKANPNLERPVIVAGSTFGIEYGTGAIGHAGDCAVYISYDASRSRRTMRWVKIANLPDCRSQINQLVPIVIPSELPAGDAVFRWDQYALHQVANVPPFIEWFIQCADVTISSLSTRTWDSFNSFSMIDNGGTPAYPSSVSSYRSPYNSNQAAPGDSGFFMTGPACIDNAINQCALTAVGTAGYTGFGGEEGVDSPVPVPSPTAVASPSPTVTAPMPYSPPIVAPESSPLTDAMCCYDASCSTYGTSFCNPVLSWCSTSAEACEHCGGTLCVESAGASPIKVPSGSDSALKPEPEPEAEPQVKPEAEPEAEPEPKAEAKSEPEPESEPASEPAPELEQEKEAKSEAEPESQSEEVDHPPADLPSAATREGEAQCCYYRGCSSYGTSSCNAAGTWCSRSAEACASCGGTLCTTVSMLSETRAKKHKFLHRPGLSGNALLQTNLHLQDDEAVHEVGVLEEEEL